jgi:hypothetical protein
MAIQRPLAVSSLLAASLLVSSIRGQDDITPKAGQPFPEIAFPTLAGGKPVTLASFRGKKVLLIQFASW